MVACARAHPFPPIWHPRVVQGGETSLPVQGGHVMVRELRVLASVPVILLFAGILGAILTGILCSHHPNERCCSPGNPCSPRCLPLLLTPHQFSSPYSRSHLVHRLPSSLVVPVPPTALHGFDHNKTPSYMERLDASFSYMDSVLDYLLWCKYRSSVLCPLDCI